MRYNTVEKLGWSVGVQHHPIVTVIENVLMDDWEKPDAKLGVAGRETPELVDEDPDCPVSQISSMFNSVPHPVLGSRMYDLDFRRL